MIEPDFFSRITLWGVPISGSGISPMLVETSESIRRHAAPGRHGFMYENQVRQKSGSANMYTETIDKADLNAYLNSSGHIQNEVATPLRTNRNEVAMPSRTKPGRIENEAKGRILGVEVYATNQNESDTDSEYDAEDIRGIGVMTVRSQFQNAIVTALESNDWNRAEAEIQRVLAEDSENSHILGTYERSMMILKLAEIQGRAGRWDLSLNTVKSLDPLPNNGQIMLRFAAAHARALALFSLAYEPFEFEEARSYCYKAIKLVRKELEVKSGPETIQLANNSYYLMGEILKSLARPSESAYFKQRLPPYYEPPDSHVIPPNITLARERLSKYDLRLGGDGITIIGTEEKVLNASSEVFRDADPEPAVRKHLFPDDPQYRSQYRSQIKERAEASYFLYSDPKLQRFSGRMLPLHEAVRAGHHKTVRTLLGHGLSTSGINEHATEEFGGYTPLHLAVLYDRIDIIQDLLAAGAEVNALALEGRSALGIAMEKRDISPYGLYTNIPSIIALLSSHGARVRGPRMAGNTSTFRPQYPGDLEKIFQASRFPA